MIVKNVSYSRLYSLPGYENEKIGVEFEIQIGDDINKVLQEARNFVEFNHKVNGYLSQLDECEHVLTNTDDFTGKQVMKAEQRKAEILEILNTGQKLLK